MTSVAIHRSSWQFSEDIIEMLSIRSLVLSFCRIHIISSLLLHKQSITQQHSTALSWICPVSWTTSRYLTPSLWHGKPVPTGAQGILRIWSTCRVIHTQFAKASDRASVQDSVYCSTAALIKNLWSVHDCDVVAISQRDVFCYYVSHHSHLKMRLLQCTCYMAAL